MKIAINQLFIWICLFLSLNLFAQESLCDSTLDDRGKCPTRPTLQGKPACALYGFLQQDAYIIPAGATSSSLNKIFFQNENVFIQGHFLVNSWIVFNNCNVRIAANATITITSNVLPSFPFSGAVLMADATRFFGCDGHWSGFVAGYRGCLVLQNSFVTEANKAVEFRPEFYSPFTAIQNTQFTRNQYGLTTSNWFKGSVNLPYFSGNIFDGSKYVIGSTIFTPENAIQFVNATGSIGSTGPKSEIKNYNTGIRIYNNSNYGLSNLKINSMFKEGQTLAKGVLVENSTLRSFGDKNTTGCEIFNCCDFGVISYGSDLLLENAKYYGAQDYGIYVARVAGVGVEINIKNNYFNCNGRSNIFVERSEEKAPSIYNNISLNEIDLISATSGINVEDFAPVGAKDHFRVQSNTPINKVNVIGKGITIKGKSIDDGNESINFTIESNQIVTIKNSGFTNGTNDFGIELFDCDGNLKDRTNSVSFNRVYSTEDDVDNATCAIHIDQSRFSYLCKNYVHGAGRGVHIAGDCDNSYFGENQIDKNTLGLHIACTQNNDNLRGILGNQLRTKNIWNHEAYDFPPGNSSFGYCSQITVTPSMAARNDGIVSRSLFFTETNLFTEKPSDIQPVSDWFIQQAGNPNPCGSGFTGSDDPTRYIRDLVTNNANNGIASLDWENRVTTLIQVLKTPSWLADSNVAAFYQFHQSGNTSEWRFAKSEYDLSVGLSLIPASLYVPINIASGEIKSLAMQMDSLGTSNTLSTPSTTLAMDSLATVIVLKDSLLRMHTNVVKLARNQFLTTHLNNIQSLPTNSTYETNRKSMDIWFVKSAMGDTVDATTMAIFRQIANQDPEIGGSAVWEARRWLPKCERSQFPEIEDKSPDLEELTRQDREKIINHTDDWQVFPNPANDILNIKGKINEGAPWKIQNTMGQQILTGKANGQTTIQVDIASLVSGIYYFSFDIEGLPKMRKFVKL